MWADKLAEALKELNSGSELERKYYKGTYHDGKINLYGGRIKLGIDRCDMAYDVRYQLYVDFDRKTARYVPRVWNNGDQCWCIFDGGSMLIVAMA